MFFSRKAVPSRAPNPWGRAAAPAKVHPSARAGGKAHLRAEGRECKVPRAAAPPEGHGRRCPGLRQEWEAGNPSPSSSGNPRVLPILPRLSQRIRA